VRTVLFFPAPTQKGTGLHAASFPPFSLPLSLSFTFDAAGSRGHRVPFNFYSSFFSPCCLIDQKRKVAGTPSSLFFSLSKILV